MSTVHTVVYVHLVRLSVSSPWLLDDFNCGSHCCNSTLPPPATCARVLRENTGFCVGVRRPHSRGLRYIRRLWQVACSSCAVKSMNMVGLLVEQLRHTATEVGVNLFPDKDIRKRQEQFDLRRISFKCMHVSIQIRVSVWSALLAVGGGVGVLCGCLCLCSCVHWCSEVINLNPGA